MNKPIAKGPLFLTQKSAPARAQITPHEPDRCSGVPI